MTHFNHIKNTFTLDRLPLNIRASKYLARWPFIRRYHDRPVGWRFLPSVGRFYYERAGQRHHINFNGRNLQFHALYDAHYRYGYELETAMLISTLCRGEAAFLDVGSNWGYFSLLAASLPDFNGRIYAIEPNPRTFDDLIRTIEQASLSGRVTPCQFGVGRIACEMAVDEADQFNTGVSKLIAEGEGEKIPVKPIDELDVGRPGLIKIDAEGMELEVLSGATNTLAEAKPFIVLENFLDFSSPETTYASLDFLTENDYRVFIPALQFMSGRASLLATYGRDFRILVDRHGEPQIAAVEVSPNLRFLLGSHLNLLGVHSSRVGELWESGIRNLGAV